jgi:LacI family transcriptional regulator
VPSTPRSRATLVDVAKAAQVSRQTVSNAVNNPERVAPETLERVLSEIERLGFHPNRAARALRRQRANAIGFQIEPTSSRGFRNLLDPFLAALTECAQRDDAHIITFVPDQDDVLGTYARLLSTQVVDGFVLSHTELGDPRADWLREQGVPFVSVGRIWGDPSVTEWVDVDGGAGTASAVEHLRQMGYRRIAWLGWPDGSPVGNDRRDGWARSCRDLGQDEEWLSATTTNDARAAAVAAAPLLDRLEPGDAVVCVSDVVALAVTVALGRRGLRPGEDIGVVGFDDGDIAEGFGLSTVRQPLETIAALLIERLEQPTPDADGVLIAPTFVRRESTVRQHPPSP